MGTTSCFSGFDSLSWGILSCGGNSAVVVVTVLLVESPLLVMVRAAVLSKSSGILRDDV